MLSENIGPDPSAMRGQGRVVTFAERDAQTDSEDATNRQGRATTAPVLRDYQVKLDADVTASFDGGARSVLAVLPTGGGKGVLIGKAADDEVARGGRVLILAHRAEILAVVRRSLKSFGVPFKSLADADPDDDAPGVVIASIATMARRLKLWAGKFTFVVVDEAHHVAARSWAAVVASQPTARLLGWSATPQRLDGRGLGDTFETMVQGPPTGALTRDGWLAQFTCYEPAVTASTRGASVRAGDFVASDLRARGALVSPKSVVAEYRRLADGLATVCFSADREHSRAIVAALIADGVPAAHVDGETPDREREAALAGLADGSIAVLSNVQLFTEGVDVPSIGAVILARPTLSLALYLQMVGRALRLSPGKDRALVLDMAGNARRHGLPDAPREWSLDAPPRKLNESRKGGGAPAVRRCWAFGALNARDATPCPACAGDPLTPAERREVEVRLAEDRDRRFREKLARARYPDVLKWCGGDEARLRLAATARGYSSGWVWHRKQEHQQGGQNG